MHARPQVRVIGLPCKPNSPETQLQGGPILTECPSTQIQDVVKQVTFPQYQDLVKKLRSLHEGELALAMQFQDQGTIRCRLDILQQTAETLQQAEHAVDCELMQKRFQQMRLTTEGMVVALETLVVL